MVLVAQSVFILLMDSKRLRVESLDCELVHYLYGSYIHSDRVHFVRLTFDLDRCNCSYQPLRTGAEG